MISKKTNNLIDAKKEEDNPDSLHHSFIIEADVYFPWAFWSIRI
jgi:hypothetical protein